MLLEFGRLGVRGKKVFRPDDLANLAAWYQFGVGITEAGAGVSVWADQSGNSRDLLQGTDTNRPLKLDGETGADIIVNGDFTNDTNWTSKGTGWSIGGGVATVDGSQVANTLMAHDGNITVVGDYLVVYTITAWTAGQVRVFVGGGATPFRGATGTYTEVVTSGAVAQVQFQADAAGDLSVDNIAVYPITGTTPVINFDGVDNFFKASAFTLNQPTSVYFLGKQITWTSGDKIFDGNTANQGIVYQSIGTPQLIAYAGTNSASISLTLDLYGVISTVFNGASGVLQLNNGTPIESDFGARNMAGFTLGADGGGSSFSNIQVKEVIIYSVAHDAATRARVINYLNGL